MSDSLDLYHPLILEHRKHPSNFYPLEAPTAVIDAYNPLCGDQYKIYMKMDNAQIAQISFHGYGCAISKAVSSMLMQRLQGLPLDKARTVLVDFLAILDQEENVDEQEDALSIFQRVRDFPERKDCVVLSASAIIEYIDSTTR